MKGNLPSFAIVGGIAVMPILSAADKESGGTASPLHVRTEFDLTVRAPYNVAFPLFGPVGERSWAGADWNPQFIYPSPAADVQGTVFTVKHGTYQAVWVNTAIDLEGHHIQYAYVISDVMVATISLTFLSLDSASTKVTVVYERTALNVAANDHVQQFGAADRARGADWERAINGYLEKH
jgi:hypothetical protein